jgi:hypothetical protein
VPANGLASPDWGERPEVCWLRKPYALRGSHGRTNHRHYVFTDLILVRDKGRDDPFGADDIIDLKTLTGDIKRVALAGRYLFVEKGAFCLEDPEEAPETRSFAVIDLEAHNPVVLPLTEADLQEFLESPPGTGPLRFLTFDEFYAEVVPWWRRWAGALFGLGYLVACGAAVVGSVLSRRLLPRPLPAGNPLADRPWERPGILRRDYEPHRSNLLITLSSVGLAFGILSLCAFPLSLGSVTLGIAAWVLAHRDLAAMRHGPMDRAGTKAAEVARRHAFSALVLSLPSLLVWVFVCWGLSR